MPGLVFCNPANYSQKVYVMSPTSTAIPAGYVLMSGSDGSIDRDQQTFGFGRFSGGYPAYGKASDDVSRPTWP